MLKQSPKSILTWLIGNIAHEAELKPEEIDPKQPIFNYGVDSINIVLLANRLSIWLNREIDARLFYNSNSIEDLSALVFAEYDRRD